MKRRRHTPEQIVRKLREVSGCLVKGRRSPRRRSRSRSRSRPTTAGATSTGDEGRRRQAAARAERENARLKRIVADKELEIDALKEIAKGNW